MAAANSDTTRGFMKNSRMPSFLAFSGVMAWLYPVHRMMGMSGLIAINSPENCIPDICRHGLIRYDEVKARRIGSKYLQCQSGIG